MKNLVLKNVTKSYQRTVLDDVSFEIKQGEFISIIGPSGSGKTTLLRCLAGLETLTKGSIVLDKVSFHLLDPQERNISMVLQETTLFPQMNVFKNIAFPLKNKKYPKDVIQEKVLWAVKWLGIESLLKQLPHTLSGGEQQRVALARSMVKDSTLFLLDEPLSSLDIQIKTIIQNQIKQLHQETKKTIVYITHDHMEAMSLSDRIVVMKDGKSLQIGTPKQLYQSPNCHFVAQFMSEWGFYTWRINSRQNKEIQEQEQEQDFFDKPSFLLSILDENKRISFMSVRSEHFQISDIKPENVLFSFEATVIRIEYLGSRQKLYFNLEGNVLFVIVSSNFVCQSSDKYHFFVLERDVFFFDDSLKRL